MLRPGLLQFVTTFVFAIGVAYAQDWPSFRGGHGSGVAAGAHPPTTS